MSDFLSLSVSFCYIAASMLICFLLSKAVPAVIAVIRTAVAEHNREHSQISSMDCGLPIANIRIGRNFFK